MRKFEKVEWSNINVFLSTKLPDSDISFELPNHATFVRHSSRFDIEDRDLEGINSIVIIHSGRHDYHHIELAVLRKHVGPTSLRVFALFDTKNEYVKYKLRH